MDGKDRTCLESHIEVGRGPQASEAGEKGVSQNHRTEKRGMGIKVHLSHLPHFIGKEPEAPEMGGTEVMAKPRLVLAPGPQTILAA